MENVRPIFIKLFLLITGPIMIWYGAQQFVDSGKLVKQNEPAQGAVAGTRMTPRRSGWNYYLRVEYRTAAGQPYSKEFKVEEDIYQGASASKSVTVYYYPPDPTIASVGAKPERLYGILVGGLVFLGAGLYPGIGRKPCSPEEVLKKSAREGAEKISKGMVTMMLDQHEYAAANAKDFPHLDLAFYDRAQQALEKLGFALVCDQQNLTLKSKGISNGFERIMLNSDHLVSAGIGHIPPKTFLQRLLGAPGARLVGMGTEFSDGTFVSTINSGGIPALNSPPQIVSVRLPADTAPEAVFRAHSEAIARHLAAQPGRRPMPKDGLEGIRAADARNQKIRAAYRREVGLQKEELMRLAGKKADSLAITEVHKALEEQKPKIPAGPDAK